MVQDPARTSFQAPGRANPTVYAVGTRPYLSTRPALRSAHRDPPGSGSAQAEDRAEYPDRSGVARPAALLLPGPQRQGGSREPNPTWPILPSAADRPEEQPTEPGLRYRLPTANRQQTRPEEDRPTRLEPPDRDPGRREPAGGEPPAGYGGRENRPQSAPRNRTAGTWGQTNPARRRSLFALCPSPVLNCFRCRHG